jgi:hypothetical protein
MEEEEWFVVVYAKMCTVTEALSWIKATHEPHFEALLDLIHWNSCHLSDSDLDAIITNVPTNYITKNSTEVMMQILSRLDLLTSLTSSNAREVTSSNDLEDELVGSLLQRAANCDGGMNVNLIKHLIPKYPHMINCNVK